MPRTTKTPIRAVKQVLKDSGDPGYVNRLLVGTPTTGIVRMEWVAARWGQIIPMNWSTVNANMWMDSYIPLRFQVADAQNLIVKAALQGDFEWVLFIEHDTCPPMDAFIRLNEYMLIGEVPVVSGLYYSKSRPSLPIVFRGRGNGVHYKFKLGDKVWADGVPTGFLLMHHTILKAMWDESPDYLVGKRTKEPCRRVFETPRDCWYDSEYHQINTKSGTSDLHWCDRIMQEDIFRKAGWPKYARKRWPFLVDTRIFCKHVDVDGTMYPHP